MSSLPAVLKYYSNRLDARTICLSSLEGSELLTGEDTTTPALKSHGCNRISLLIIECRANSGPEDVEILTSLVPSFSSSTEQVWHQVVVNFVIFE